MANVRYDVQKWSQTMTEGLKCNEDNELYLITFAFSNANLLQKNSDFNILLKMKRMICTVKLNDHYKNAITDLRRFVFGLNLEK